MAMATAVLVALVILARTLVVHPVVAHRAGLLAEAVAVPLNKRKTKRLLKKGSFLCTKKPLKRVA
jgi:hypothetical protein